MHRIQSLALAAGFVAFVGLGAAAAQTPPPYPEQPKKPAPTMPQEKANLPEKSPMNPDAEFAQKAAMGGKHEVDGARFAVGKAQNAELKAFANRLIKDHTAANNELSTLMKNKKIPMGMGMEKKDEATKDQPGNESWRSATGAAFDRAYVDHLVQEHEKTITLFETEVSSGSDAQLKAFATKTLPTIKDHLKVAQDLQKKLTTT
jgi:putative membrane protein